MAHSETLGPQPIDILDKFKPHPLLDALVQGIGPGGKPVERDGTVQGWFQARKVAAAAVWSEMDPSSRRKAIAVGAAVGLGVAAVGALSIFLNFGKFFSLTGGEGHAGQVTVTCLEGDTAHVSVDPSQKAMHVQCLGPDGQPQPVPYVQGPGFANMGGAVPGDLGDPQVVNVPNVPGYTVADVQYWPSDSQTLRVTAVYE